MLVKMQESSNLQKSANILFQLPVYTLLLNFAITKYPRNWIKNATKEKHKLYEVKLTQLYNKKNY